MKVTFFASILFSLFTFSSTAFATDNAETKPAKAKVTEVKKMEYRKTELEVPKSTQKSFEHKVQTYHPTRVWRLRFYITQAEKSVDTQTVIA